MPKNGKKKTPGRQKILTTLRHEEATRKNIPTAELQSFAEKVEEMRPRGPVHYPRSNPLPKGETRPRNGDLDPQLIWNGARIRLTKEQIRALEQKGEIEIGEAQLVWRGKDNQDWSDLVVQAPPLYIQEKIHPKVIIDDLLRRTKEKRNETTDAPDLFADFNGLVDPEARLEFYQHDQHWSNRMILGDSLQVMASLAEREGLRGKVQCIYVDPPYGIKFNSNWQVSTLSRDVKDGKREDISREPEQVKAFRDTWKDGVHSYLAYLRDRLTVARELLTESGSIFVQIGEGNVHLIRALLDEVFGSDNYVGTINFQTAPYATSNFLASVVDYVLWYGRTKDIKYRGLFRPKTDIRSIELYRQALSIDGVTIAPLSPTEVEHGPTDKDFRQYRLVSLISQGGSSSPQPIAFQGRSFEPPSNSHWKVANMGRVIRASRIQSTKSSIQFRSFISDFPISITNNIWTDTIMGSFHDAKVFIVQTNPDVPQRCILMTTDPGDIVLDPTCGSGTTAYVAEQWGRRWITIDTSRVALALSRARIMSARYPYYYLSDTPDGRAKEQEISGKVQPSAPTHGDIR